MMFLLNGSIQSWMACHMRTVDRNVRYAVEAENWQATEGDISRSCHKQDERNAWAIVTQSILFRS